MSSLDTILDNLGYKPRKQQTLLYEHLLGADENGVVAQAGTGTGKSLAVLAAAHDRKIDSGLPSLVVTPTNVLMDQYTTKDAPGAASSLGIRIESLKGRNRYLCASARAFGNTEPGEDVPQHVDRAMALHRQRLYGDVYEPAEPYWFGCPGSDDCDPDNKCHYRKQKEVVQEAHVIVTNAHLLVIDNQLKRTTDRYIFPELGTVFVDESHTLEAVLRDFATQAINLRTVNKMGEYGEDMATWLHLMNDSHRNSTTVKPDLQLVEALRALGDWRPLPDEKKGLQNRFDVAESARTILRKGADQVYVNRQAVLWFAPAEEPKKPRLVSTQINLSNTAREMLTAQSFGLVSATIPSTMRPALGVPSARFVDVGHPFDYARQASISFSAHSGAFKDSQDSLIFQARVQSVFNMIVSARGGALLLFSAFSDLEAVYDKIGSRLKRMGYTVLKQEQEGDKAELGERFKHDGDAVLFGSDSFATGFDVPGNALRLVVVWKLPYGNTRDPVTGAIMQSSIKRYEDLMLVKVVQAAGRLIRTDTDKGHVFIVDSRGKSKLIGSADPMVSHLSEFKLYGDSA